MKKPFNDSSSLLFFAGFFTFISGLTYIMLSKTLLGFFGFALSICLFIAGVIFLKKDNDNDSEK